MRASEYCYGWQPDVPDHRDYSFAPSYETLGPLAARVDLRPNCPPVYRQYPLHSCPANVIAAAIQYDAMKQNLPDASTPSRLFIYYNARAMTNAMGCDTGCAIRVGIKSIKTLGVCPETMWPYDPTQFTVQPPQQCYDTASAHKPVRYHRLQHDLSHLKACLMEGFPFLFGISLYESFKSADVSQTGNVPLPSHGESLVSGHALMAVGYDDAQQQFIVRNSWGTTWGAEGYCYVPYAYLMHPHLVRDFWTIRVVQ